MTSLRVQILRPLFVLRWFSPAVQKHGVQQTGIPKLPMTHMCMSCHQLTSHPRCHPDKLQVLHYTGQWMNNDKLQGHLMATPWMKHWFRNWLVLELRYSTKSCILNTLYHMHPASFQNQFKIRPTVSAEIKPQTLRQHFLKLIHVTCSGHTCVIMQQLLFKHFSRLKHHWNKMDIGIYFITFIRKRKN